MPTTSNVQVGVCLLYFPKTSFLSREQTLIESLPGNPRPFIDFPVILSQSDGLFLPLRLSKRGGPLAESYRRGTEGASFSLWALQ